MMIVRAVMIRMKTVKMTIIIASSALPMLPSATIEMYTIGKKTEMVRTTMMMSKVMVMTMRMMKHQALILRDV